MGTGTDDILISPYGGKLVDLLASNKEREELRAHAGTLTQVQLTPRLLCDLELLAVGGFSPIKRFMGRADYERVLGEMRLTDGTVFPIPVTLNFKNDAGVHLDQEIALTDSQNNLLALMRVEEIFEYSREEEVYSVCGTTDPRHPLVAEMNNWGELCATGALRIIALPQHYDFKSLRLTPSEVRGYLQALGRSNVVAFQTRNPLHRAHEEITARAAHSVEGTLLLHPAVGLTKIGDIDHFTRVRSYRIMAERYFDPGRTLLA